MGNRKIQFALITALSFLLFFFISQTIGLNTYGFFFVMCGVLVGIAVNYVEQSKSLKLENEK